LYGFSLAKSFADIVFDHPLTIERTQAGLNAAKQRVQNLAA